MRYVLGIIVFLASLGAVAVTMMINATYQFGQGGSPSEALMRAAAMAVFDCVKAGLPVGMSWWWARRQWQLLVVGGTTFAFCFVMSLISAVGFYAANHATVSHDREGVTTRYRAAGREVGDIEKRLSEIGKVRSADAVEAALKALRTDKRYFSSKSCADATLPASREFCRDYFTTEGELAGAREAQRLENRRAALRTTMEQLIKAGAEKDADPQATLLGRLLPFLNLQDVKLSVDLLPSLLLEIVAGFGLLLATSMMQWTPRAERDESRGVATPQMTKPPGVKGPEAVVKPMTFKVRKDGTYVIDAS
jgi:hypothetical protein